MTGMNDLIIGQEYTLTFKNDTNGIKEVNQRISKRMILVGKYKYHAVFMTKAGYTVSFTYWELGRCLKTREKVA